MGTSDRFADFGEKGFRELLQVGVALSAEKDLSRLLEKIAATARHFARAEGATVYVRSEDRNLLRFAVMQNTRLGISLSGEAIPGRWPDIRLYLDDGSENHANACAHCALAGETIGFHDVYHEAGFDFSGTRDFDRRSSYRSCSMLLVPMRDHEDEVIGVLQLINALSSDGEVVDFPSDIVEVVDSLASQAAIAIANVLLVEEMQRLNRIGMALSTEKNFTGLLEKIAATARSLAHAEGATIYVVDEGKKNLLFAVVQNEKFPVDILGGIQAGAWPGISLYLPDGSENHSVASAHCALTGMPICFRDVYHEAGYDFSGTREFDRRLNYRSQAMLLLPMRDHEDEVIGVLQLLNAKSGSPGQEQVFHRSEIERATGLASQAAVAITNARLIEQTEKLLKSFVRSIALAIDEKSPYTAGHIARVVEITDAICRAVDTAAFPPFADIAFDDNQLEEIRLAAWLHDVGKIATPQFIVDKATKLETIVDRIELIRLRLEILRRDLAALRQQEPARLEPVERPSKVPHLSGVQEALLETTEEFLREINLGSEYMQEDALHRIKEIAGLSVVVQGREIPLLNDDEVACCSIRKGTLTEKERLIINRHITTTISMLNSLPFPKKWRNIPEFAGMHHEKLDGSGYPRGLSGEKISLPARIIAVADIFEALTAADRPYKRGKTMAEAVDILRYMVRDNQLDGDICNLLFEGGLAGEYARKHLLDFQLTPYTWRGREYRVR